eukprot:1111065-Pelagomonas_calceolata.AAC.1
MQAPLRRSSIGADGTKPLAPLAPKMLTSDSAVAVPRPSNHALSGRNSGGPGTLDLAHCQPTHWAPGSLALPPQGKGTVSLLLRHPPCLDGVLNFCAWSSRQLYDSPERFQPLGHLSEVCMGYEKGESQEECIQGIPRGRSGLTGKPASLLGVPGFPVGSYLQCTLFCRTFLLAQAH